MENQAFAPLYQNERTEDLGITKDRFWLKEDNCIEKTVENIEKTRNANMIFMKFQLED